MRSTNYLIRIGVILAILGLMTINTKSLFLKSATLDNGIENDYENFLKDVKMNEIDNVSFSQSDGIVQHKLDFDIEINMDEKIIQGYVRIHYKCQKPTNIMGLDTRDLTIPKVFDSNGKQMEFTIYKNKKNSIGDGLFIKFDENCTKDSFLDIYYKTSPNALGIQFSDPSVLKNENKNYSFLYTHGEAIYSRTFFPSQDTPSLKVKSSAKIRIAQPYAVLFSGEFVSKTDLEKGIVEYKFTLDKEIPTYLISFAAGIIMKKEIPNSRCEVWGERETLKWVDESFKYCEKYIKFYETYKPLAFKKMVFLIVPDDFPFSGMENPYVIYISEAVLAKDRSYTSTIAHEIAHFWSGNLVTNKNWGSFWLNEGITTYLNRKAFRVIHGDDAFSFDLYNGIFKLKLALKDLKKNEKLDSSFRSLYPKITDDPYITFSRIPYEKGAFFLYYLETVLGDPVMQEIMSDYFNQFEFESLDSDTFINFFKEKIMKYHSEGTKKVEEIDWNEWLYGTEMIPFELNISSKNVEAFKLLVQDFIKGNKSVKELSNLFSSAKIVEKDRILKEISEEFNNLTNATKSKISKFLENEKLFGGHINVLTSRCILQAQLITDNGKRTVYLLDSLNKFKFYKVAYLKKVFSLIKDANSDKNFLTGILNSNQYRFNALTIQRIKEFIDLPPKNNREIKKKN